MNDDRELFYERFADDFDAKMDMYDLNKRLDVVYRRLLGGPLTGLRLLDAGCGTGYFSQAAAEHGAEVCSLDLGVRLLRQVRRKCTSQAVAGSALELPFASDCFDVVVSSEMIEHLPTPRQGFAELARVLKPGGRLALTTPNRFWHWSVAVANRLGIRPYEGLENWVWPRQVRRWTARYGLSLEDFFGFHLFPFQLPVTHPLLDALDRFGRPLAAVTVNVALLARKAR